MGVHDLVPDTAWELRQEIIRTTEANMREFETIRDEARRLLPWPFGWWYAWKCERRIAHARRQQRELLARWNAVLVDAAFLAAAQQERVQTYRVAPPKCMHTRVDIEVLKGGAGPDEAADSETCRDCGAHRWRYCDKTHSDWRVRDTARRNAETYVGRELTVRDPVDNLTETRRVQATMTLMFMWDASDDEADEAWRWMHGAAGDTEEERVQRFDALRAIDALLIDLNDPIMRPTGRGKLLALIRGGA